MKYKEKLKARELRRKEGLSLVDISKRLEVSKGSVSVWVRDINLTKEQKLKLSLKNPVFIGQNNGAKAIKEKAKEIRKKYQEVGRKEAQQNNLLHCQGCMLYWAEGTKSRNCMRFSNSDPFLMLLFKNFLENYFNIPNDKIILKINCYTNNGIVLEDIIVYWLNFLNLSRENLRKCQINQIPSSSKKYKRGKLLYGVANLEVYSVELVQRIYGAIKEYASITEDRWLD